MNLLFRFLIGLSAIVIPLESNVNADDIDFGKQIRPILSRHCIACHGPDEEQRQSDLRLDTYEGATESAIVPGEVDESDMVDRILSDDEDLRMPPAEHGDRLTTEEIETIKKWIQSGAKYEQHWSFVKPQKITPPETKHDDWARNEIDQFVAAQFEKLGTQPSAPADAHRLIRRVALDLTGLPPTRKMVDRFVSDPSDQTYASIVDELLSSPAYGEHWGAMWLDIARYADTIGYAEDKFRSIWPWRDWVIDAFNNNLPYDQFTVEQLAGDLLKSPTDQQLLATAFHRNTLNNSEGGTNDEEFRTIAVKDRINTTVNVWMGLTLRCAECHTHKYDPISQEEYYQFLAFFNQSADSDKNDERPRKEFYPKGRASEFKKLDAQIANQKKQMDNNPVWTAIAPDKAESRDGTDFKIQDDKTVLPIGVTPKSDEYQFTYTFPPGRYTGLRLEVLPDPTTKGNVGRSAEGSFVLSQIRLTQGEGDSEQPLKFSDAEADHSQVNYHVKLAIRDEADKAGWAVNKPDTGYRVAREAILTLEAPLEITEPTKLTLSMLHASPWDRNNIGKSRLSYTSVEAPAEKYRKKQLEPVRRKIEQLIAQRKSPIRVPIMTDLPESQQRKTHLMVRGSFLQPGKEVGPAVMKAFHPLPENSQPNRLAVANWLIDSDNPLTARVTVNRFWARIFGIGIVETEEDFGTQGSLPTHPELLDWLAVDLRENGWDIKRLLKQMVTSSTYRQTGVVTADRLRLDPRNQWLTRGPRFRLPAEVVRDQALAVSGLLSTKMYGPPVYPPSPIKRIVNAFTGGMTWTESQGPDRYRRAIYTYLKRSQPHPLFETFDMATRDVCSMRRLRTNTPLQSFMTLNDVMFIEAAQAMAKKMHVEKTVESQIAKGLEIALLRPADEQHVATLVGLYQETIQHYESNPDQALEMALFEKEHTDEIDIPQRAALVVVANVILNMDSFLTR